MKGYRSLDGGAVIMLKIANYHDVIDLWSRSLSKSLGLEPHEYKPGRYFSVRSHDLQQGRNFYRYHVDILDDCRNCFFSLLFDIRGFVKVEIRYPAQRDHLKLNLEYRDLFEYLNIKIIEEKVSRVDLSITIEKSSSEVIKHVLDGTYYSLLNRKTLVSYGMPPSSVRIGNIKNVEVGIYDKYDELLANSAKLSYQLKIDDFEKYFNDCQHVTRIEYRLSRLYLRNIGLTTPDEVNDSVFDLYVTMQTKYFQPTDRVPDGHHQFKPSSWWSELPPLVQEMKDQKGRIMFNIDKSRNIFRPSPIWTHSYNMLFSRAKGYLGSIIASMARVVDNVDTALNIVMARVVKQDNVNEIRDRAITRFAIQ